MRTPQGLFEAITYGTKLVLDFVKRNLTLFYHCKHTTNPEKK